MEDAILRKDEAVSSIPCSMRRRESTAGRGMLPLFPHRKTGEKRGRPTVRFLPPAYAGKIVRQLSRASLKFGTNLAPKPRV